MAGENLVKVLQIAGAALGIPAAAAGTFAAYQNYVSTDGTCQKLRSNIVAIMERSVAPETKRTLLRKDVNEFDKLCGEGDPDARTIFHAAITPDHPAPAAAETANTTTADAGHGPAAAGAQPDSSSRRSQLQSAPLFGAPGAKEHYGWVALGRRQSGAWVPHFNGYTISDTSLPPSGTVLSAQIMLPVWSEPQGTTNDQTKLQSRLPTGACVRVLSTRGGTGRLWAEVAPASCS
jgi:hypothetical protein